MGIATQYEGGLRFDGDQMYITTSSGTTVLEVKSDKSLVVTGAVGLEASIDVVNSRVRLGHHTSGGGLWFNTATESQYWFAGLSGNSFRLWRSGNKLELASDGTLTLNEYGAGLLKTNSSGQVSLDTSTYLTSVPDLAASKITSGTFADARIASAANWNAAYNVRLKQYTFSLTSLSNSNFYPIVFSGGPHYNSTHYFNFSQNSQGGGDAFNNNMMVGWLRAQGWSDMAYDYDITYNNYDDTERTILGVYRTTRQNNLIIYVRGGETYKIESTSIVTAYTSAGSMYNEGTTDGNASVAMIRDANDADIDGQADASQHTQRLINLLTGKVGKYHNNARYNHN